MLPFRRPSSIDRRSETLAASPPSPVHGTVSPIKQLMLLSFVALPPAQHGIQVAVELYLPKIPGGRRAGDCGPHVEHAMDCGGVVAHPKSIFEVGERMAGRTGFRGTWGARVPLRARLRA